MNNKSNKTNSNTYKALRETIREEIKKALLKEEKSLTNNTQVKKLIDALTNNSGYYINQELKQIAKKADTKYNNNFIDLMDDIEAAYKSIDKKVAKMILMAIQDSEASEDSEDSED